MKMAEISHREKILLGYSPNALSNFPSRQNSEVDFSDVFGGPPRHSLTHELGKDSFDSVDDEETQRFRSPWVGFGEKPVFGDEVGTRRRYHSEDFFDDIFKGDQPSSCSQSPRSMPRRDPFSSAPGSRIMSPSRAFSPMVEPFASPAKFSLPAPLANADFVASPPINQCLNSPSFSMSRFNQTFQNHDVLRADVRLSYRPSPLSHQNSVDGKVYAGTKNIDGSIEEPDLTKDSKGSEVPANNAQFHFSIYKWASKGVPSVMSLRKKSPSRLKERIRFERCSSTNGVKSVALDTYKEDMLAEKNDILSSLGVKDCEHYNASVTTKIEESQSFDDISPVVSNVASYNGHQNSKEQACKDATCHDLENPREFPTLSKRSSRVDISNDSPKSHGNTSKSYVRSIKVFLQDEENGNEMVIPKMRGKESLDNQKGQPSFDDDVSNHKINKSKMSQSFREGKGDSHKSEGTKKVKDFVKIFNQEPSSKAKKNVLGQSQSSRGDETSIFKEDNKVKSVSTEKGSKMQASKAKESKTLPKALEMVDGHSFLPEKQQFDVKIVGSVFGAPTSAMTNEPISDAWRDAAPNINATPDSGSMNRESPQEIDIILEVEHQEETQDCESKILQWSKGKEGNIRALLSTLQYVLWPDSGWKPVPLVDIIEANAVKKTYQRALLRLHPDKLQQKGAAVHQKFIAEKVFDILQDAWDHFNSLGNL